jgi:hypothetical protein
MDVMNLLAQARPDSLDPSPETDRRAADLAQAIAQPRLQARTSPAGRPRPRASRRRVITAGIGVAALAGAAGAAVAVTATQAGPSQPAAAHGAGVAVGTQGQVRNAILTALSGVNGDVFYDKITETYSGSSAKWDGATQSWAYPLQPQPGQQAYVHYAGVPGAPGPKSDSELIWTEPPVARQGLPNKTKVIDVQYDSRTWSITTAPVNVQSESGDLNALRESIVKGQLTEVGTTVINGQTVLELTSNPKVTDENPETWWVDPVSYLPVRSVTTSKTETLQVDYGFLPPTKANIAKVTVTIPPGFTRTPTIEK